MDKATFLAEVKEKLSGLPRQELEQSLEYYREMIEDRMEDGMQEEEAVAAMGSVDEAAAQILNEISLPKLVKANVKMSRTLRAWELVLLIAGLPVWVPILICVLVIFFLFYLMIGLLIFVLYVIDLSLAVAGVAGIAGAVLQFVTGRPLGGWMYLGAGLFCAGVSVLLFFGTKHVHRALIRIGKRVGLWIRSLFLRRFRKTADQEE